MQEELEKEMEILKTCRSDNVIAYYGCIIREHDTWVYSSKILRYASILLECNRNHNGYG